MKTMVKLAVLLATLLLLSVASFAGPAMIECNCYDVTATNLDDPGYNFHGFYELCLDYENKSAVVQPLCEGLDLSMFLVSSGLELVGSNDLCAGFFKFHGSDLNVATGKFYDIWRFSIWAHKTAWDNCPEP
jgi:hypothetical protein